MRLKRLRIENFRSFKDETIEFDDYTCLVGPNGVGKSAVLTALNVFFRNNDSTSTNVLTLSEEDFHLRNTAAPVKITLTFVDLPAEAQHDLKYYYRQDQLIVFAKAEWDNSAGQAVVKQGGSRKVMREFVPFFEAIEAKMKVPELKTIYAGIKSERSDLPNVATRTAMADALRTYEEAKPELCTEQDASTEFYGWSKGKGLLDKYLQWVYVPAVKDASTEQEEGARTALGQLLRRTIRTRLNFDDVLADLREEMGERYKEIIGGKEAVLEELQKAMEGRLRLWATPKARLKLEWNYDKDKSVVVGEPLAHVRIGEDKFIGDVARIGHGMQRAFLLSILQELATGEAGTAPTLLLGFEEPELYQHPPQAQHIASLLRSMANTPAKNTQVVLTTHSPYFVSGEVFENVRIVRKCPRGNHSSVTGTTYEEVAEEIAAALGEKPQAPTSLMARVEQIMQPSQREMFFSSFPILVEGLEDVAFISSHFHISDRWADFRRLGCHFVIAAGKTNLSRPLAIANKLGIPRFVVFDGDADKTKPGEQEKNRKDNSCILKLCALADSAPFPDEILWGSQVTMWPNNIGDTIRSDFGVDTWNEAQEVARGRMGLSDGVKAKNRLLVTATLEELNRNGKRSAILERLCETILLRAESIRQQGNPAAPPTDPR